uniref:Odorant receptor n=1 Tax=Ostrinia nubilalis TaxID=29057 RepID=A0A0C4UU69_OSTNU|nr:putative pheromone receptor OR5 [Ostrinia nubilalis]
MLFRRAKSPLALKYFKSIRTVMVAPGVWPAEIFGEKISVVAIVHRVTLPYHTSLIVVGELYYIWMHMHELTFLDLGHMIITTLLGILTAVRSILPQLQSYHKLLLKFINVMHLMHSTNKGPYYNQMNDTVDKVCSYYTKFSLGLIFISCSMFNVAPFCNNIANVFIFKTENYTLEFSLYYQFPGIDPTDYFTTTSIYNFYLSYNCAMMVSGLDLILFLIIFQIIGHVYILRYNLENFPWPKNKVVFKLGDILKYKINESITSEMFDAEENKEVRFKLAECIEYHKKIIGFTDEVSALFGPILACNYLFHLICCSLLLLECSEGGYSAMLRYGPMTVLIYGQLIQMSVIFELLGSETEKLPDSAYFLPWECMDTSNRRTACIMLHKMQYKISLKALGLAAVGVSTMTGILKTTFSYYAFLQTMGD